MRLVVAECSAQYTGRLNATLPLATRLIVIKADGSVLLHSDGGSYKPLNWMSPPCTLREGAPDEAAAERGVTAVWTVQHGKSDDCLVIEIGQIHHDSSHVLGLDPGVIREGMESALQELLAAQIDRAEHLGEGHTLVRREYMTAIGPVDILARSPLGGHVAVEIKRRGEIDGVEQLTRYLELLNRDPHLAPVRGVFAAQEIKPQARVLATDRGIDCMLLDYEVMAGIDDAEGRLF